LNAYEEDEGRSVNEGLGVDDRHDDILFFLALFLHRKMSFCCFWWVFDCWLTFYIQMLTTWRNYISYISKTFFGVRLCR